MLEHALACTNTNNAKHAQACLSRLTKKPSLKTVFKMVIKHAQACLSRMSMLKHASGTCLSMIGLKHARACLTMLQEHAQACLGMLEHAIFPFSSMLKHAIVECLSMLKHARAVTLPQWFRCYLLYLRIN